MGAWRTALIGFGLAAALLLGGCAERGGPVAAPEDGRLRIASYNVHYIVTFRETGAWSMADWARRRGPLDQAFKALTADIIGFQEMESFSGGSVAPDNIQLDWLLENNPGYAAAAIGEPARFPSTQPILYRRDAFELLDQGWFFFSETPDALYPRTYDGGHPAFASWAQFKDAGSGVRFRIYNVHFDYASFENRRRSALLVKERIAPPVAAGETVFVIGDINAGLGSKPARIVKEAGLAFTPVSGSTWHMNRGLNLTGPVDHIAATPDAAPEGPPVVLRRKFGDEWPSDHYPVFADFTLPERR